MSESGAGGWMDEACTPSEGLRRLVNLTTDENPLGTMCVLHIKGISAAYTSRWLTAFRRFVALGGLRVFRQHTPEKNRSW